MRSRRILSMIALVLVLSLALVSCETAIDKSKDYINTHKPQEGRSMVTINMYIPSDGTLSSEAVLAMQEQFNEIVEEKYNTHVVFHLTDLKTYESYLKGEISRVTAALEDGAPTSLKPTVETNDQGVTQAVFPKEADAQLDIFVVNGLALLQNLVKQGFVRDITTEATSKYYRVLSNHTDESTISESIFWNAALGVYTCQNDGCTTVVGDPPEYCPASVKSEDAAHEADPEHQVSYKAFGSTLSNNHYGIPSNSLVGQYTYLLIDRKVADQNDFIGYLFLEAKENLESASAAVSKAQKAFDEVKHDSGLPNYGSLKAALADASAIYDVAKAMFDTINAGGVPVSVVYEQNRAVVDNALKNMAKILGVSLSDITTTATGDYRTRLSYGDDYYVTVTKNPALTNADIFAGMFCISSQCANPDRAMEILVELNTNARLHTILQFGAEGIHYTVTTDENGNKIVALIDNPASKYSMHLKYTGNVSALYACPALGIDVEYAHYLYLQNKDASK